MVQINHSSTGKSKPSLLLRLKHLRPTPSSFMCLSFLAVFLSLIYKHTQLHVLHWNADTRSTPTTTSKPPKPETLQLLQQNPKAFWNCHLSETPCRYFDPYRFFHEIGLRQDLSQYKRLGGLNNNLPAMTALYWSSTSLPGDDDDDDDDDDDADELSNLQHNQKIGSYLPHNISFIHVHKAGGTSVKTLLAQAKNALLLVDSNQKYKATIETYKYSFGGSSNKQKEINQQKRQNHIEDMIKYQREDQQSTNNAVVFTTVRDPIERFVSAVQQVMHYHEEFRSACLQWTARSTLQCAIQYIQRTDYIKDVHLLPMATHFRLWDDFPGVSLAVIHLKDMPVLAQYLTGQHYYTEKKKKPSKNIPHGRDRSQVEYATSPILARMSVQDCTSQMLTDLCNLYSIDVSLMQSLGYNTPYCIGIA